MIRHRTSYYAGCLANCLAGVLAFALCLAGLPAFGQATAVVQGTVLDETGAAIAGAQVQLFNPRHPKHLMAAETETDGGFVLFQVPFSAYTLTVEKEGFQHYDQPVDIHSSAFSVDVTLQVGAHTERVEVTASYSAETHVSTLTHMDEHELERKVGAMPGRLIESAIMESPGVAQNANGRLHIRGAHYQVSFMIDGLPISDQLSIDFGNPFDARNIEAMEIYTGNFPAEYGNKVSGVVNVSTKSGIGSNGLFHGSVGGSAGSFDSGDLTAQLSGGTAKWGYFVSVAGGQNHRFLDPPSFGNLHNDGNNQSAFFRVDYSPNQNNFFNFSGNGARSRFDVPNLPSQHLAGQDQQQKLMDTSFRLHWLHVINSQWSMDVVPYFRTALAQLFPSPGDTPVTASQARHLTTAGGKWTVNYNGGGHRFKAGIDFFGLPVSEFLTFGLTDTLFNDPDTDPLFDLDPSDLGFMPNPDFNPNLLPYDLTRGGSLFQFATERTGSEYSFFVQDHYTYRGLVASFGVRYDNYNFVLAEDHWSPRLGLAYNIDRSHTTLRASYNRLFQTPSNENLLFSTSQEAGALVPPDRVAALGAALLIVRPERVDFWEVGVQQTARDWFEVDISYYTKRIDDYHDNDQLLNTTIVFPAAISKGEVNGLDLSVNFQEHRGVSGMWAFSWGKAVGIPPLTGGLFLGEEALEVLNAGPFRIDHDQTYTSQGNISYDHSSGVWTALSGRFDSGPPVEIDDLAAVQADPDVSEGLAFVDLTQDPMRVKSRLVWDWSIGYDFPRESPRVSLQFDIRNLTDQKRLFNFLSVFSGTHVTPPRAFSGRLRYFF
jgi:hypothetical protein